jgi:hypothetical protein
MADPALGETLTMAPLIVRDLAIVGPAGGEFGIRGFVDATDLNTGEQVWRTYTRLHVYNRERTMSVHLPPEGGVSGYQFQIDIVKSRNGSSGRRGKYGYKPAPVALPFPNTSQGCSFYRKMQAEHPEASAVAAIALSGAEEPT